MKKLEEILEKNPNLALKGNREEQPEFVSKNCSICGSPKNICRGTGWVFNEDQTSVSECPQKKSAAFRETRNKIEKFLGEHLIGMPRRFQPDKIPDWDTNLVPMEFKQVIIEKIQALSQNLGGPRGLCLMGSPGTGKTYSLCYIVNSLNEAEIMHCAFFNYPRLLAVIRDNFRTPPVLERLKHLLFETDLIVLDDLGMERRSHDPDTSWSVDLLYQVLDYRCDNFKPVLISTNRDPEEIETNLGKGIWSRIRGMTETHIMFTEEGDDLRASQSQKQ